MWANPANRRRQRRILLTASACVACCVLAGWISAPTTSAVLIGLGAFTAGVAWSQMAARSALERRLRASEQRWEFEIRDADKDVVDLTTLAVKVHYSNHWKRILGYEGGDPDDNYRVWFNRIHPDDRDEVVRRVRAYLERKTDSYTSEYRIRAKDGSYRWVLARGQAEWDAHGTPVRLVGTHVDVTERKNAESALIESEKKLRESLSLLQSTLESTADGVLVVDNAGRISAFNKKFLSFMRIPEHMARDGSDGAVLALASRQVENRDEFLRRVSELYSNPESTRFDTLHMKDGRILERFSQPQRIAGQIVGRVWSFRDVTAHRKAEEALRRSEAKFRELFQHVPVGLYQSHPDGRILTANVALARMFGYDTPAQLKASGGEVGFDNAGRAEWVAQLLRDGKVENWEAEMRLKDGRAISVLGSTRVVYADNGEVVCYEGTIIDITARKLAEAGLRAAKEQAEEASRTKSEFLATVSHEIRTPMNGVLGMTGLLLDTPLNDQQRDFAESIRASGEALLAVINDILDFSKIEAGKMTIETAEFDLAESVEELTALLTPVAARKHLELVVRYDPAIPRLVQGDAGRIRQVLMNLVGNAIKFTDAGWVAVEVAAEPAPDGAYQFEMKVCDSGIGIPKEKHALLFQEFSQVDSGANRRHNGTGLGLAISRRLATAMNGELGFDSEPGAGSTFWFRVPLAVSDIPSRPGANLSGMRVLIADDNPHARAMLAELTGFWGMRTEAACGAQEAVGMLMAAPQDDPFQFVLADSGLFGNDALQAGLAIKAASAGATPSVVLLASTYDADQPDPPAESNCLARLVKPIRPAVLWSVLAAADGLPGMQRMLAESRFRQRTPLPKLRLLVAEDNMVNQKLTKSLLTALGADVDVVANGIEATQMWRRLPYDAILMDCQMPEMDGYKAAAEIRASEEPGRHIPIIALTANVMKGDRERCVNAGMDDYIAKPVNRDELERVLRKWTQGTPVAIGASHS